ncbi:hypothetical protein VA7868_01021 [Vibrio aerogenes CECT 7868]|uniref:DUF2057 domain-containing protein n=1 Tax=Vibrio aerogenes CECT 7868 TaxID=1216006 RepID=A0A1M5X852_9VIBR|nr:DUF2057 domain-containing protein [Vibrio aerogenes]SHH95748.1 hypothetical protein VA7868_01021 [Vibrio aerogenes CECT 7868]
MRRIQIITIVLLGLLAASGVNAATISSEKAVEILALDGQALDSGRYVNDKTLEVAAGQHQLVIRYYGDVRKGSKSAIYSTPPYIFTVDLKQNDQVTILAPSLKSYSQAKAYFRRGAEWTLRYQDGTEKKIQYEKLTGKGLMPFTDIEKAIAAYNKKHRQQQFLPATQVGTPIAAQVLQKTPAGQNDTLIQTIQLLYNNATPEQKSTIKQWMSNQP